MFHRALPLPLSLLLLLRASRGQTPLSGGAQALASATTYTCPLPCTPCTVQLSLVGGGGGGGPQVGTATGGAGGPVLGNGVNGGTNSQQIGGSGGTQTAAGAGGNGNTFAGTAGQGGGSWANPGRGGAPTNAMSPGSIATTPGWNAAGGTSSGANSPGGGGGGGWYGGGGGGCWTGGNNYGGGGGGGSSYVNAASVTAAGYTPVTSSGPGTAPTAGQPGWTTTGAAGLAGAVSVLSVAQPTCSPVASQSTSSSPTVTRTVITAAPTRTLSPSRSARPTTSPCPGGYYCATPGGVAVQCPGGWFCPVGSTAWNGYECGRGNYCPAGSAAPISCGARNTMGALGLLNGPAFYTDLAACVGHCFNGAPGQLSTCA